MCVLFYALSGAVILGMGTFHVLSSCATVCRPFDAAHMVTGRAQVVGVPDSVYGEEVCAVIKMSPNADAPLTVDDIANYCKGRMAK